MIPILILATVLTLCSGACWWLFRYHDRNMNHHDNDSDSYHRDTSFYWDSADHDATDTDSSYYDIGGGDGGGFDGGI